MLKCYGCCSTAGEVCFILDIYSLFSNFMVITKILMKESRNFHIKQKTNFCIPYMLPGLGNRSQLVPGSKWAILMDINQEL